MTRLLRRRPRYAGLHRFGTVRSVGPVDPWSGHPLFPRHYDLHWRS